MRVGPPEKDNYAHTRIRLQHLAVTHTINHKHVHTHKHLADIYTIILATTHKRSCLPCFCAFACFVRFCRCLITVRIKLQQLESTEHVRATVSATERFMSRGNDFLMCMWGGRQGGCYLMKQQKMSKRRSSLRYRSMLSIAGKMSSTMAKLNTTTTAA